MLNVSNSLRERFSRLFFELPELQIVSGTDCECVCVALNRADYRVGTGVEIADEFCLEIGDGEW